MCTCSKHDDQDDKIEYIGIRQLCTQQNFPNPDSSKCSTLKILHHMVVCDVIQAHHSYVHTNHSI